MPPVTVTLHDDITGTATNLGSTYTLAFGAVGRLDVLSGSLVTLDEVYGADYYNVSTYGPNAHVGLVVGGLPLGDAFASLRADLVAADAGLSSWDGYQILVYGQQTKIAVDRMDNGTETEIINYTASAAQVGDLYLLERLGTTVELWRQRSSVWTSLGSVTDANYTGTFNLAWDIYDPGSPGEGLISSIYGGTSTASSSSGAVARRKARTKGLYLR